MSAGSCLFSGVLEAIRAGEVRERQRELDKHLSGVQGRARKGSPPRVHLDLALPCYHSEWGPGSCPRWDRS